MSYAWITQRQCSSRTARTVERVAYLDVLRPVLEAAAKAYFAADPRGEQFALALATAVGRQRVAEIEASSGRSFDTIKKDLGLFAAIVLADIYGPDSVETYRQATTKRNATRARSSRWSDIPWVSKYTPHRLTEAARIKLFGTVESR